MPKRKKDKSKKTKPTPADVPQKASDQLSVRTKILLSSFIFLLFLVLSEGLLAIMGVQTVVERDDPFVGFESYIQLFESNGEKRQTASNKLALFNQQSFNAEKNADCTRIFLLGGSTTYGRPFGHETSFSGWLDQALKTIVPDRKFEVVNCGGISYASYRVAALMEELVNYQPDVFIIYCGNNEFLEKRTYQTQIEEPELMSKTKLVANKLRLYALLKRAVEKPKEKAKEKYQLTGEVKELLDTSAGLDYYFRDREFEKNVLRHYAFNLERIVEMARGVGAEVILCTIPVNESDFSPFKSEHTKQMEPDQEAVFQARLDGVIEAVAQEQWEEALQDAKQMTIDDPLYAEGHYWHGRSLLGLSQFSEAQAAFVRALEEDVCPLRAWPAINRIIADVARTEDVTLLDFQSTLKAHSKKQFGHESLGNSFFLDHVHLSVPTHGLLAKDLISVMGEKGIVSLPPEWEELFDGPISTEVLGRVDDSQRANAFKNLSKVLIWAGKKREAQKYIDLAAELPVEDWEIHQNAGVVLLDQGDAHGAISRFKQALELNDSAAMTWDWLGRAYHQAGDLDRAIESDCKAMELDPNLALPFNNIGTYYHKKNQLDMAESHLQKAIQLDPAAHEPHNNLGNLYFEQGRLNQALTCYDNAIKKFDRFVEALVNRGMVLGEMGRYARAVDSFQKALVLEPVLSRAHLGIGKAHLNLSECSSAVSHLQQAVEIQSDLCEAYEWLARSHATQRDSEGEFAAIENGLLACPENPQLLHFKGRWFAQHHRPHEAEELFGKVIEAQPEFAPAWRDLGQLHLSQQRIDSAIKALQQAAVYDHSDDQLEYLLGEALILAQQFDQAKHHLERAIAINPNNANAILDLGVVFEILGNPGLALTHYRNAAALDPNLAVAQDHVRRLESQ